MNPTSKNGRILSTCISCKREYRRRYTNGKLCYNCYQKKFTKMVNGLLILDLSTDEKYEKYIKKICSKIRKISSSGTICIPYILRDEYIKIELVDDYDKTDIKLLNYLNKIYKTKPIINNIYSGIYIGRYLAGKRIKIIPYEM